MRGLYGPSNSAGPSSNAICQPARQLGCLNGVAQCVVVVVVVVAARLAWPQTRTEWLADAVERLRRPARAGCEPDDGLASGSASGAPHQRRHHGPSPPKAEALQPHARPIGRMLHNQHVRPALACLLACSAA